MNLFKPSIKLACYHLIRSFDKDNYFTSQETALYAHELNEAIDKKLKEELEVIFK